MKKIIPVILAAGCLTFGILNVPKIYQSNLPKTSVTQVKSVEYTDSVSAKGEVTKKDSQAIITEMPLVVSDVFVESGGSIAVGQQVISVDRNATARKIMKDNQYSSLLAMSGGTSVTSYDDVLMLIPERVYSKVSGTIESVYVKAGDTVAQGYTLVSLIGSDGLVINAPVSENYISKIQVGQNVLITGNGFDGEYSGVVEEIANEAKKEYVGTTEDTVVEVKIRFTDADDSIRMGYTAKVKILTAEKKTVHVLPYETVMEDENNKEYVYVFNNGVAVRKDVQTGLELGEGVEVVSGVAPGDPVLTSPGSISEGEYVKLVKKD